MTNLLQSIRYPSGNPRSAVRLPTARREPPNFPTFGEAKLRMPEKGAREARNEKVCGASQCQGHLPHFPIWGAFPAEAPIADIRASTAAN